MTTCAVTSGYEAAGDVNQFQDRYRDVLRNINREASRVAMVG